MLNRIKREKIFIKSKIINVKGRNKKVTVKSWCYKTEILVQMLKRIKSEKIFIILVQTLKEIKREKKFIIGKKINVKGRNKRSMSKVGSTKLKSWFNY